MKRTLIAPGVHLSCDPAEKFNRCRISIHFAFPAQRATATAHALLPLVLERGYADCPDMTRLTKKLAKLYGADLTVDARPLGCSHNLCVSVTGIKDPAYMDFMARRMVEMAGHIIMGYLLLQDTQRDASVERSLRVYVKYGQAEVAKHADFIANFRPEQIKDYLYTE